jgi:hypothetical protein
MTTMQRYYVQASRSEIQPRIKHLVEYLLGEANTIRDAGNTAGDGEPETCRAETDEAIPSPEARQTGVRAQEITRTQAQVHAFCARNRALRRPPRETKNRLLAGGSFLGWRDLDSNRGHHNFQARAEIAPTAPKVLQSRVFL